MGVQEILYEYSIKKAKYDLFCTKSRQLIEDLLKSKDIEFHSITNRLKDEDSLEKKIIKKNKYTELEQITDLAGVRIITYYADTVDIIAKLIEEEFEIDIDNSIDKRKAIDPDRFGYMSLHYVVKLKSNRLCLREYSSFDDCKIEIQIRTILQHTWAEIEHDLGYKRKVEIPKDIRRSFSSLAGLLEIADREFIGIRNDIDSYSKNIDKQLEQSFDNIQLDNITLKKYLKQSKIVKELNTYMAKINHSKIVYKEDDISNTIEELANAGYTTISEIDEDLHKYSELIKFFADKMLKDYDDSDTLYISICLFYLCFAKITETLSSDEVCDYLEENHIGMDPVEVAYELCDIHDEYIEMKKQSN